MPPLSEAEQKLMAARTRLILDKPFLGALVLRLPMRESTQAWCVTTATDARAFYYNRTYIEQLSLSEVQFVLAHEALHCGLSHFARRDNRARQRWDVACDYAVNQLLVNDTLEAPPGILYDPSYEGLSAEEIYPYIDEQDNEETLDQHLYEGPADGQSAAGGAATDRDRDTAGDTETDSRSDKDHNSDTRHAHPAPPPLSTAEKDQLDTQWQQRLAGAAQQAAQAGKLDERMARLVERLLRPSVPWRAVLARFMNTTARVDYNLSRPSQRREGEAILPSLYMRRITIVVALDTSGSISSDELNAFIAELNAIKASMNAHITLLACDAALDENGPWVFESWEALRLPTQLQGGGSTDFSPVFEWVNTSVSAADLIIYFTDAKGKFPERSAVPTLWLVKGNADVPWGQRIQLN